MSRERETQLILQLSKNRETSNDARALVELLALRYERRKEELVGEEVDPARGNILRGRAQELRELLKQLRGKSLDKEEALG